jgi:hypothetical protein
MSPCWRCAVAGLVCLDALATNLSLPHLHVLVPAQSSGVVLTSAMYQVCSEAMDSFRPKPTTKHGYSHPAPHAAGSQPVRAMFGSMGCTQQLAALSWQHVEPDMLTTYAEPQDKQTCVVKEIARLLNFHRGEQKKGTGFEHLRA